ncbi:hypothetical protein PAXRUDRAFT_158531 [Paxillus rubicundulus Ve08.2h10]|uniref:DUF4219 domain-containing protein n=1 Tax=Paxillus rubicundulus Ve08.2h10 TaxID=930991 RepID=A0A0D0CY42_9AGAM|nr:hypothetical protein PAXRUDRAFT_158531 [Paxillus rubicundulus Ve08.2h10]
MGKYNHIPTLTGVDNFHAWQTDIKYALGAEDLWCHVSMGSDPSNPLDFASVRPTPADITQLMEAEITTLCKWLIDDVKAKGFIHCFLSMPICQLISNDKTMTAQAIWELIGHHYGRKDPSMQFVIHEQLAALHMKDMSDASRYVGEHLSLQCCLLEMGTKFSEEESIFQLLTRLPQLPE